MRRPLIYWTDSATFPFPPYPGRPGIDPRPLALSDMLREDTRSGAAPTAGLHLTERVFASLAERGVRLADVTLHVGLGTFRPIEVEEIHEHVLHAEWAELTEETSTAVAEARNAGGRIVAVGTTSARTLETAALSGSVCPFSGETALYSKPGHLFQGVDVLLTNFHLPRSSLLVLVAAFAGYDLMREAYRDAIREKYRFYSYGDAMLIL